MQRMDPCVLLSTEEGIIQAFPEFFQNLFSSSSPVGVVECMAVVDKKSIRRDEWGFTEGMYPRRRRLE
jgi:hypothetical protein